MDGKEAIAIIRAAGISQAEFARLVDMSPVAVSKWASGGGVGKQTAVLLRVICARPEFVETLRQVSGKGARS